MGPQIVGSGQLLGLGNDIPAFGAVVQALQNIQDANIVAEPHVYTADNQEAELEVGNRVPTQGGTTVSGGQRQRLAIARALIRRPAIYLFDDSFSALDLATDARLRAALAPVTREATVLVVAGCVVGVVARE